MIYVLAYPKFEKHVLRRLDDFRRVHEPERAKLVVPHLTLVFGVKQKFTEDVVGLCEELAGVTSPISLAFSRSEISYDTFENVHKLSLVCNKGAELITALHEKLYQGPHQSERHPDIAYRPHMTVGTNFDVSKLENVDVTTIGQFPIKAEFNHLSVVQLIGKDLRAIAPFQMAQ